MVKKERTTMHIAAEQRQTFDFLQAEYTYKTKQPIKVNKFFDFILETVKQKLKEMPVLDVVDGKIVETYEEKAEQK